MVYSERLWGEEEVPRAHGGSGGCNEALMLLGDAASSLNLDGLSAALLWKETVLQKANVQPLEVGDTLGFGSGTDVIVSGDRAAEESDNRRHNNEDSRAMDPHSDFYETNEK